MADLQLESNQLQIPIDKIPLGLVATKFILSTIEILKSNDPDKIKNYITVVQHFDDFIVQYKDREYDREMDTLRENEKIKGRIDTFDEARAVFRVIMKLLQRGGFMPVKTYEADMIIDSGYEEKVEEEEDDGPAVVQEDKRPDS